MDASTERLDRISFAKCMVEVSLDIELPYTFPVKLLDGNQQHVKVSYLWKLEICTTCHAFGHTMESCFEENKKVEAICVCVEEVIISKKPKVKSGVSTS